MKVKGFTLMELSIVLCLIALAIAASIVVYAGARGSARRTICLSNLKSLGMAMQMYSQDNDGWFPPSLGLDALDTYVKNREVFRCPAASRHRDVPGEFATDYIYRPGLTNEDPAGELLAADDEPRHQRGANMLAVDGAARWQPASRWRLFVAQTEGRDES
ncbi:MAG: DUF1559 domain-containing protein [Armatimonadota bacterium]|nr:MAG: DUF1559 domain-containing protein [Armatimonadota bacterium]